MVYYNATIVILFCYIKGGVTLKSDDCCITASNRREFYRVQLVKPLKLTVVINRIQGKLINKTVGIFPMCNISAGGLAFKSPLKFSINHDISYNFIFFINGKEKNLSGTIIRLDSNDDTYMYGVNFSTMPHTKAELLADIHQLATYNKRGGTNPEKYHHY